MIRISLAFTGALALFAFSATGMAAEHLEAMHMFDLETASDVQISPDGARILYVRNFADINTDSRYSNIWGVNFDGSENRPLTSGNNQDTTARWSPDGGRIAFISDNGGTSQIHVRYLDTNETVKISNLPEDPAGLAWSPDGTQIAFTMLAAETAPDFAKMPAPPEGAEWKKGAFVTQELVYRFNGAGYLKPGYHHIYVIPAEGGTARQISSGPYHHAGPVSRAGALSWTADGSAIVVSANRSAQADREPNATEIYAYAVADGTITRLTDHEGPDSAAAVSPNGELIAFTSFDDQRQGYQVRKLYVMAADGGGRRVISGDLDRGIYTLQWAADSNGIYASFGDHGMTKLGRFGLDGSFVELADHLGGSGSSGYGGRTSFSVANGGQIAALYMDPHTADEVGAVADGSLGPITHLNDDIFGNLELGAVEEIRYASSVDQREIQGWIIKPPGFDAAKKYPLIIEIHGGPFADYGPRFDIEKQLMAAEGYVVLYTNPRGSTTYGEEFGNLIHHTYPGDDFYDLNSGVDAVIGQGYIDDSRLYVTGGSGGGVLTAWMIGNTTRFKAAVIHYPVIDWESFNLTTDIPGTVINYWFPGAPWDHREHYFSRSLLSKMNDVKTPTMLITGEADWRTPISQAEQYYTALKWQNIEAAMVRMPDEPHGMRAHPSHHISKMLNTLGWFNRFNKEETVSDQ